MNSYSAPRVPPKLDKAARDPPDPPQPFPVPFRPPVSACGARFFSFFTGNTSKKSPEKALSPQPCHNRRGLRTGAVVPRSSDSRKVRPPGREKKVKTCPPALPATVLAGGSCSSTVMLTFGDASFRRRVEVHTAPRVPCGTRILCAASHIMSCRRQSRRASRSRRPPPQQHLCTPHAPHAPLNPLADFRLLRRPTLLLLEEVIAAQCFRPPRCSARRPRRHTRLRL